MDAIDGRYLMLPMHAKVRVEDVEAICHVIRGLRHGVLPPRSIDLQTLAASG